MKEYLNTLISEKKINTDLIFEVQGETGTNLISLKVVIEHVLITTKKEQEQIKNILVKIDFLNRDVLDYFKHLAGIIAR